MGLGAEQQREPSGECESSAGVSAQGDGSQAAARDISNHTFHSTFKHQTTVIHLPERRPESQLQADFEACTGIWCRKEAREWLEVLLEHHGFTVRELSLAWRAKSLNWDSKAGAPIIQTPLIEAIGGWALVALVITLLLTVCSAWVVAPAPRSIAADLSIYGAAAVCLGMIWMVMRTMLWPRRVALRVRRVLY